MIRSCSCRCTRTVACVGWVGDGCTRGYAGTRFYHFKPFQRTESNKNDGIYIAIPNMSQSSSIHRFISVTTSLSLTKSTRRTLATAAPVIEPSNIHTSPSAPQPASPTSAPNNFVTTLQSINDMTQLGRKQRGRQAPPKPRIPEINLEIVSPPAARETSRQQLFTKEPISQKIKDPALQVVGLRKPKELKEDVSSSLVQLSDEQQRLLETMVAGENVYYTGKAGSGKTEVIKRFVAAATNAGKRVAVTAPTGIAAAHINGGTLHSTFGLVTSSDPYANSSQNIIKRAKMNRYIRSRFELLDVLVIDEVSMVKKADFMALSTAMATLRGKPSQPFGGVQVVFCGDFFQLPPVVKNEIKLKLDEWRNWGTAHMYHTLKRQRSHYEQYSTLRTEELDMKDHNHSERIPILASLQLSPAMKKEYVHSPYVFTSQVWNQLEREHMHMAMLKHSHRQADPEFVKLLDSMRMGAWDPQIYKLLDDCVGKPIDFRDGTQSIKLCAYRRDAEAYNLFRLNQLTSKGPLYEYHCVDSVGGSAARSMAADDKSKLLRTLKPMLSSIPPDPVLSLKVGAQVILIRNKSVKDGLVNGTRGIVVGFEEREDPLTEEILMLPIVKFSRSDGGGEDVWTVGYQRFEQDVIEGSPAKESKDGAEGDISGSLKIRRDQIPLRLAWALTVHRSQGMTLDNVQVDFGIKGSAFADGQAYVAMSRVKSLEGLSLAHPVTKGLVRSSPLVKLFYEGLEAYSS